MILSEKNEIVRQFIKKNVRFLISQVLFNKEFDLLEKSEDVETQNYPEIIASFETNIAPFTQEKLDPIDSITLESRYFKYEINDEEFYIKVSFFNILTKTNKCYVLENEGHHDLVALDFYSETTDPEDEEEFDELLLNLREFKENGKVVLMSFERKEEDKGEYYSPLVYFKYKIINDDKNTLLKEELLIHKTAGFRGSLQIETDFLDSTQEVFESLAKKLTRLAFSLKHGEVIK